MTNGPAKVSYAVVVVLFHPSPDMIRRVASMGGLSALVIAVDNSVDVDATAHSFLTQSGVTVIHHGNCGGLAGAYNRGVRLALSGSAELVFFLDQDSDIAPDYFDRMLRPVVGSLDRSFIVGPKVYEIQMDVFMPVYPPKRDLRHGALNSPELTPAAFVISSGSMVSRPALQALRTFREDWFIEWLDVDLCLRAQREGIPVLVNSAVVLRQTTGDITQHGKRFTTNHPAWRKYYRVRNAALVSREHGFGRGGPAGTIVRGVREAIVVGRFEHDRSRKIVAILVGLADGVFGRSGLFEVRHPRIHRYCMRPARPQDMLRTN